jgi:hypothetical protein
MSEPLGPRALLGLKLRAAAIEGNTGLRISDTHGRGGIFKLVANDHPRITGRAGNHWSGGSSNGMGHTACLSPMAIGLSSSRRPVNNVLP